MNEVSKCLSLESEWLPIMLALDILNNVEKSVYRAKIKSSLDNYFFFSSYFYGDNEDKVIQNLTEFVEKGLIDDIEVTHWKAENNIDRVQVGWQRCYKGNLEYLGILRENDMVKPFIAPYELKAYDENDIYFEYNLKVNLEKIRQYLDEKLDLLKSNKFLSQAYKYDKQRALLIEYLKKVLTDFPPNDISIIEFATKDLVVLPLLIYEQYKLGNLLLKHLRIYGDDEKLVFTVDILNDRFVFKSDDKPKSSFDSNTSILLLGDTEIKIKPSSQQYWLLDTVFGEPNKLWLFDEVKNCIDGEDDLEDLKKWYNVGYALNRKIALESKLQYEDFFKLSTNTIRINSKYL